MLSFIKNLLGIEAAPDYKELLNNGAIIIDVRTEGEYKFGHIRGSKNIPLQSINNSLSKIDKNKPVITCCASGARSGAAKRILKANGYQAYNGGSWLSLNDKVK